MTTEEQEALLERIAESYWKSDLDFDNARSKDLIAALVKHLSAELAGLLDDKENGELRREISLIDEAFARRPALADCKTRYEKAMKACAAGSELERVKAERDRLLEDKERLDWLESNKVSMNQLCNRDEVKPYWHLYWTPNGQSHCTHSGNQDAALATLRQAITKAMYEEIKTALKTGKGTK